MGKKLKLMVIFGGQSGEHDVSVVSADSVVKALDREKYEIQTLGITKDGKWLWGVEPSDWLAKKNNTSPKQKPVALVLDSANPRFISLDGSQLPWEGKFDIVFPVLHGPKGEDGTIQGLFDLVGFPYVGSGVLGSSLGMDKDKMKDVFIQAGLPVGGYLTLLRKDLFAENEGLIKQIEDRLAYPCFIKPANLGSSVGISKAKNREELKKALKHAALFDRKLVVEKGVAGREIELSVLGNDDVKVSLPGEIIPGKEFYDYDAKYADESSKLIIPAELDQEIIKKLQEYAAKAFHAVEASGLSRVDFFVTASGEIFVNEINTLPGFTKISMYPKLWEATGIPYSQLLDNLIELGFERNKDLKNSL